jgi:hypothetical protein
MKTSKMVTVVLRPQMMNR